MKQILFSLILFWALSSSSQETATTESGKTVILNKNGTWKYAKEVPSQKFKNPITSFSKSLSGENYSMSGIVDIENGKDEKVKVTFTASVPKSTWDNFIQSRSTSDADFFYLIANMLSIDAKYSLKNELSFQPFPNEFFSFIDGKFMSSYKMTGRNGYGNEVETSALVEYDPNESNKNMSINIDKAPSTPTIKH